MASKLDFFMVPEEFPLRLLAQAGGEDQANSVFAEQAIDITLFIEIGGMLPKGQAPTMVIGIVSFDGPYIDHVATGSWSLCGVR